MKDFSPPSCKQHTLHQLTNNNAGGPWRGRDTGQLLQVFAILLIRKSYRTKESWNLPTSARHNYVLWKTQSTQSQVTEQRKWKGNYRKVISTGINSDFVHWAVKESLNCTLRTIVTRALIVLLLLHMNLAHLTRCKTLLSTWKHNCWRLWKVKKPARTRNQWLPLAVWCPTYSPEKLF